MITIHFKFTSDTSVEQNIIIIRLIYLFGCDPPASIKYDCTRMSIHAYPDIGIFLCDEPAGWS